jgi:hypothetical protein
MVWDDEVGLTVVDEVTVRVSQRVRVRVCRLGVWLARDRV